MKTSTKALLLSGLVLPGAGHLYLKKYLQGALLCVAALIAVGYLVSSAVTTALAVVRQIEDGEVPLDAPTITAVVEQQSRADASMVNAATFAMTGIWLIGMVDSYRLGRKQDAKAARQ